MTLLAVFEVLLWRYCGQSRFVVGTAIANRTRAEIEPLIGFFVNTLALRADVRGEPSFVELLARVKAVALGAYAHQDLPFERLVQSLEVDRDLSRQSIFQTMFVLQNTPMPELKAAGLTISAHRLESATSKFDLTLFVTDGAGGLECELEYSTDLFEVATIERMAGHFRNLAAAVVTDPGRSVGELEWLGADERRALVVRCNDSGEEFGVPGCVHRWFERQVRHSPQAVAVCWDGGSVTFAELNRGANQLARHLVGLGAGPEQVVAVCAERSFELVVAVLAVLKAGAAYVPLDPEHPPRRLAFVVEEVGACAVLTQRRWLERMPASAAPVVAVDEQWPAIAALDGGDLDVAVGPENLAYIIYTSGSTGAPKGVMVTHAAVGNFLAWLDATLALGPCDRVLHKTPLTFDASIRELFPPVLARPQGHRDAAYLARVIADEAITTVQAVPSLLSALLEQDGLADAAHLRQVMCGGEALSPELRRRFFERLDARLFNVFGPTEASVDATCWSCAAGEQGAVPIGRPISNMRAYVLDGGLQPVPVGVPGDLYLGGPGLARGYVNRPELTAAAFVPDPFGSGGRLYRTGDRARRRPDGVLEYLGREDHQIKIRGVRIEPGEIETVLERHPAVERAVVIAREDTPGEKSLTAYIATHQHPTQRALRRFLERDLPESLLPAVFMILEELPTNAHGKVDRDALPTPDVAGGPPEVPLMPLEAQIAAIWRELLGAERIGRNDSFFELGGHSLLATQVASRLLKAFDVRVSMPVFFETPTVAALAEQVETLLRQPAAMREPPLVSLPREGDG
jgi:amino acid adenylation domain-containing protein